MGCNCSTGKQIKELYDKYSVDRDFKKLTTSQKIKFILQYCVIAMLMVFIIPLLLVYIIYKRYFGDNRINVSDFFGLKNNDYAKQQQVI